MEEFVQIQYCFLPVTWEGTPRNQAGVAVRLIAGVFWTGILTDARDLLFSFSLGVGLEPPLRLPFDVRLVFFRPGVTASKFDTLRW